MSYQSERDAFIYHSQRGGLPLQVARSLLRYATTINRLAELACSSEAADRDRIPCPAATSHTRKGVTYPRTATGPCLCDRPDDGHETIPRITLQDWQAERRARACLPDDWDLLTSGDPRGFTLRVIPPSYTARNAGRDRHNLDAIGVPSGPSGLRF